MPRHHLHLTVPGTYIALALVLGLFAPKLGGWLLPSTVTPIAQGSAIAMLSAIASGMMALTGVAFSFVFVAFQLSSSAYTPRLLAEFGRSRLTPHALGIFVGTFVYAALAISAIGHARAPELHAAVTWIALAWLLASVTALVLLIANVQRFSVATVLSDLGLRGLGELRTGYRPYRPNADASAGTAEFDAAAPIQVIAHDGAPLYVVQLDSDRLLAAARAAAGQLFVPFAIGDAVMPGDALAVIHGGSRAIDESLVRRAIRLNCERTIEHNPSYALRLLVDIAIRALSPAVNDPTTAVAALDQIEALLRTFGRADLERGVVRDDAGAVRVVYMHPTWEELLALGLCEIAQYGEQSVQVQRRLGALLADLAESVPAARRAAVERWSSGRQQALAQVPFRAHARALAEGRDRQGLGHTLPR